MSNDTGLYRAHDELIAQLREQLAVAVAAKEQAEQELAIFRRYRCGVCFTSAYAPCEEGTPNAVRDPSIPDGWMVCQMCACHEQLLAAIAAKERAEQKIIRQQGLLKLYQDALEQIPCPNCKLYTDGDCPCACHVFPKDRVQHLIDRAEQAGQQMETLRAAITAHLGAISPNMNWKKTEHGLYAALTNVATTAEVK